MATFRATFGQSESRQANYIPPAAAVPLLQAETLTGLTELTTSGTAGLVQSGGSDFTAPNDGALTMVCDGAVWVAIGSSPTAAVGTSIYLKADERVDVAIKAGSKVSVIDDS